MKSLLPPLFLVFVVYLTATEAPAAIVTVTNGNDSGPGSLRQAILDASSRDAINFASNVTTVNLTSGELVIDKTTVRIAGHFPDRVTVRRANNSPPFRIFHIMSSSVTVFLSRLTILNGNAVDDGDGGGIRSAGLHVTLVDCVISGNQAVGTQLLGGHGAGLLNEHGKMNLRRCTISNNSAQYFTSSSGDIASCIGGGIWNASGGVTMSESTISGNSCSIQDTFGLNFGGGGGGGIANAGSMEMYNCTISGNSVSGTGLTPMQGGGVKNSGTLRIAYSTIVDNSALAENGAFGGGIYGFGSTRTDTSIIALNNAPTGPDFTGRRSLESLGYNIIGNNADAVISSRPTDQIGTPAAPIDPLLGPLANNGGATLTHALQPGSPAIDRGHPYPATFEDQRGYGRVDVPDVGAFEFNGVPITLANISTRAFVQTGDNVMIGGFIVQGTEPKRVIVRAIGPDLTHHGVPDALTNPTLELHDGAGALIASNDDWVRTIIGGIITSDQVAEIRHSGYAPNDRREPAIIADLLPGSYTAIVRGVNNTTGVALAEVYDLSAESKSTLINISTRSFVQTGDNVTIGGFIVDGTLSNRKQVIVRAIGPELTQYGVPNAMANPTLELHDSVGRLIASNDDWQHTIIGPYTIPGVQFLEIVASGLAPGDPRESAMVVFLPPGNYTAIVRGVNNTTGVALVEVYDLDPKVP